MNRLLRIMPTTAVLSVRAGRRAIARRPFPITPQQFRDARVFAGFTREQAADFLLVSLRSIGHWETGAARPPYAAFKLLRVYRHGDLIDPRWSGYRLVRGKLVTPENHELAPSDMSWLSLLVRRAAAFSELLSQREASWTGSGVRPRKGAATSAACPAPLGVQASNYAPQLAGVLESCLPLAPSIGLPRLPPSNRGVSGFRKDQKPHFWPAFDSRSLSVACRLGVAL